MRNFDGRQERRFLRRRFPIIVFLGLLALPLGTASADILYVTHLNLDGHISVVDTLTGDVVTIPLNLPSEMPPPLRASTCIALTPDGTKLYVSTLDDGFSPADIVEIDTATTNQVTSIFRHSVGGHPCVAISPVDGTKVYASTGDTNIVVIDTDDNELVEPEIIIDTSFSSILDEVPTFELGFNPDGSTLYALASFGRSNAAKIINPASGSPVVSSIVLGGTPNFLTSDLDVTPGAGGIVYMTPVPGSDAAPPTILAFDASDDEILESPIEAPRTQDEGEPDRAAGVAITPDGGSVYVVLFQGGQVRVIDTDTNTIVGDPIPVGEAPLRITFSPNGKVAYVANTGFLGIPGGNISVIDTDPNSPTFNQVINTFDVGGNPFGIAVLPSQEQDTNAPPVAQCQNVTVFADGSCQGNASVNNGSSDPDGDSITLSQSPGGPFNLGFTSPVTLTVMDDGGASDSCTATATVVDQEPPTVTAALVPVGKVKKDKGRFRVEYSCNDNCGPNVTATAELNGTPVVYGQVVELEVDDDPEVEWDDGTLEIEAPSFELVVTCRDATGNQGTATARPQFALGGDDDDDDDDDRGKRRRDRDDDDDDDRGKIRDRDDDDDDDRGKRHRRRNSHRRSRYDRNDDDDDDRGKRHGRGRGRSRGRGRRR